MLSRCLQSSISSNDPLSSSVKSLEDAEHWICRDQAHRLMPGADRQRWCGLWLPLTTCLKPFSDYLCGQCATERLPRVFCVCRLVIFFRMRTPLPSSAKSSNRQEVMGRRLVPRNIPSLLKGSGDGEYIVAPELFHPRRTGSGSAEGLRDCAGRGTTTTISLSRHPNLLREDPKYINTLIRC